MRVRRTLVAAGLRWWLREPLLHFLIAGAAIFGVYAWFNPQPDAATQTNRIVFTEDDLRQMTLAWLAQRNALPTAAELRALVNERVHEEILSREAVALGLDKDDEIIKRRLAQKMDFLAADIAAVQNPGDSELRAWFARNAEHFALPPRVTFRHLYFSSDRGPGAHEDATAMLAKLTAHRDETGAITAAADPFMFRDFYGEQSPEQIMREFGPDFAKAVFQIAPGTWQGPIRSGYGWHLVFVSASEPERIPAFEEVVPDVKSTWLDQKQVEIKRIAFEGMRARYTVVVPPVQVLDLKDLHIPKDALTAVNVIPQ